MSMKTALKGSALALFAASMVEASPLEPRGCNGNNLLNRFRDARYTSQAIAFCETYISSVVYETVTVTTDATAIPTSLDLPPYTTTVYPSPLITTSYEPSKLSSACSCINVPVITKPVTTYVTPVITSTSAAAATTSSAAPSTSSLGCWSEPTSGRALSEQHSDSAMTPELCASICDGYTFYGVEYGSECYCGNEIATGAFSVDSSLCDATCAGDSSEICGGRMMLSLYKNGDSGVVPTPTESFSTAYVGCFSEPSGSRLLTTSYASSKMTHDMCFYLCGNAGYSYAGLEYGQECWCGNTFDTATLALADDQCSSACAGDSTETCGNGNTLQLYKFTTGEVVITKA